MFKQNYNVIGVMSGTSLDGVDLAHIKFEINHNKWSYEIYECDTISYTNEIISKLKNGINFSTNELSDLNIEYTNLLGNIISDFITKNNISNIDAVCSHGHTILHQPQNGFTLQIGNLQEIAKIVQQKIVCDFRVQDVNLGGQGAPLVPIGDKILFSEFDYCLNLGGFSNISFEENNQRIAFDISPVNTVLNFYANTFGLEYDDKGKISASGKLNSELLYELNQLEFYNKSFPKSLGFEFVKETVLPILESYSISTEDKMRTFTEHIAFQIGKILTAKSGKLLVSGGGVYNDFLIGRMKAHLPTIEIIIPDEKTIKFKEALIFALLGVLKLRNEINVLASVTGAKQDHSSGEIYE
ncbi:anhydro-N-acetylmuramic acid kinase [Flavobacterium facile]|uniref:anhydro-N-acetylmuramic acid kinase n=1 Tax=Flavobacterium facile TaxID=2893174 RepID=UPI002E78ACCB|nr:anhydro-N-acetylmuramic acid kinase [Flavobacterium sp. T-12]